MSGFAFGICQSPASQDVDPGGNYITVNLGQRLWWNFWQLFAVFQSTSLGVVPLEILDSNWLCIVCLVCKVEDHFMQYPCSTCFFLVHLHQVSIELYAQMCQWWWVNLSIFRWSSWGNVVCGMWTAMKNWALQNLSTCVSSKDALELKCILTLVAFQSFSGFLSSSVELSMDRIGEPGGAVVVVGGPFCRYFSTIFFFFYFLFLFYFFWVSLQC